MGRGQKGMSEGLYLFSVMFSIQGNGKRLALFLNKVTFSHLSHFILINAQLIFTVFSRENKTLHKYYDTVAELPQFSSKLESC